jgi:hypothetical protein
MIEYREVTTPGARPVIDCYLNGRRMGSIVQEKVGEPFTYSTFGCISTFTQELLKDLQFKLHSLNVPLDWKK